MDFPNLKLKSVKKKERKILAIIPNSEEGNSLLKWTLIAWDLR